MINNNSLPFPYPIWFSGEQREQARKLISLGFRFLGECTSISVEETPLASVGSWVFYSVDGLLVSLCEDAIYLSDIPEANLSGIINAFKPKEEIKNQRFYDEVVVGFGSNIENFNQSQIRYALDAVNRWMATHDPELAPQLKEIIDQVGRVKVCG